MRKGLADTNLVLRYHQKEMYVSQARELRDILILFKSPSPGELVLIKIFWRHFPRDKDSGKSQIYLSSLPLHI